MLYFSATTLAIISFVLVFPTLPVIAITGISYRDNLYSAIKGQGAYRKRTAYSARHSDGPRASHLFSLRQMAQSRTLRQNPSGQGGGRRSL